MSSKIWSSMWRRPTDLPFPQVWHTFIALDLDNNLVEYEIRDLPPSRFEEACELMIEHYLPDEPLARVMKLKDEPDSVNEYVELWKMAMQQGVVVACFKGEEMVGVNMLGVLSAKDLMKTHDYKGKAFHYTIELYLWLLEQFNMYENFGIDAFLLGYGMGVHTKYRLRGIATKFLKARRPMLEAIGVPYTTTMFTSEGTQKAAVKAEYTTYYEMKYETCIKMGYPLEGIGIEYVKMQGCGISK